MLVVAVCAIMLLFVFSIFASAQAFDSPVIILKSSFKDTEGRINIVGTVRNFAQTPMKVTIGAQIDGGSIVQAQTYGRVVWPLTDSPFKIVLENGLDAGDPFIMKVQEADVPNYDSMLILSYKSMAVGEDRAFIGTIKNISPFEVHNASVFAAVHSPDHKSQLDTIRSNVIRVIKPGEELKFVAIPDPAIRKGVLYYSCAGVDYNAPITTIDAGAGNFIAYSMNAAAQVNNLRYENSTDSIAFGIRPYGPIGGQLSFKMPQFSDNHNVTVLLDGEPNNASISANGKTVNVELFVPNGDHQVRIQGVMNVPEFPFVTITLASVIAAVIFSVRSKAAFRSS